uniref:Uncharacterized protein n=1 Tax=Avena sativa TaxID=4498 RepID=A0ACD5X7J8_AVESA
MALPGISWLLLSLLVIAMATPVAGSSEKIARTGLIKCYDAAPTLTNGTVFRASLLLLLASLPSAAAPTGLASLNATGHDSVFVRGLCFGDAPAPSECHGCLSAAAKNLTSGCRATTRRAGVWTNDCFVAYADTGAFSPSEDAFRSRVLLRDHVAVPVPGSDGTNQSGHQHHMLVLQAQLVALDAAANISGTRMLGTADDTSDDGWPVTVRSTVHVLAQCARGSYEGRVHQLPARLCASRGLGPRR